MRDERQAVHRRPRRGTPAARPALVGWQGPLQVRLSLLAVVVFLAGACHAVKLNVIGEATLDEFVLPVLALFCLTSPGGRQALRTPAFAMLLIAGLVTLGGYILSDVVRESRPEQYLRGWGRVALVLLDFAALAVVAGTRRQLLWWFCAGLGVGLTLYYRLVLHAPISLWKFNTEGNGYAEPLTLIALTGAYFLPLRLAALPVALVAAVSIYYDFRIQGAVCFLMAAVMLVSRAGGPGLQFARRVRVLPLAIAGALAAGVLFTALKMSEDPYASDRRASSDAGRAFGKVFALKAISESPLVGYGSWSRNEDFVRMQREAAEEIARDGYRDVVVSDSSSAVHAMFLQAWVEGGLLGTAFFATLITLIVRNARRWLVARPGDGMTPIYWYFLVYGIWHVIMSPFAAPLRINLALCATCLVCLNLEWLAARAASSNRAGDQAHGLPPSGAIDEHARRSQGSLHRPGQRSNRARQATP